MVVICKQIILNSYELLLQPKKIWHFHDGKILTVELQYNNVVVYYTNDTNADQEFFSYIMAVETGKEIPYINGKKTKYLRTLMFDNGAYVLHFYTNEI